jgi:replication factor C subunit 2/4
MTQDAQAALRRTMETYSKITRFCLICNYITRIIEPLASRCTKFRFKPLDSAATASRIEYIAQAENVPMEAGIVESLVKCSEGDLRKAITYLQTAARMVAQAEVVEEEDGGDIVMGGVVGPKGVVSVAAIEEIAGVVPQELIERLLWVCLPGKIGLYTRVAPVVDEIVAEGWSAGSVVMQVTPPPFCILITSPFLLLSSFLFLLCFGADCSCMT